ncbi:MAG: LuxR family transcriptional regulator [Burkholderiales bacterium]|nr:LuxR family transcriptional regulator [Burkholderiales bacterium]
MKGTQPSCAAPVARDETGLAPRTDVLAWARRALRAVSSLDSLQSVLAQPARHLGFRYFLVRGRYFCAGEAHRDVLLSNAPLSWRECCESAALDRRNDPLLRAAYRRASPVPWREIRHGYPLLFDEAAQHGLATGISHAIHGGNGDWSMVSFVMDRGGRPAEEAIDRAAAECHLLACQVHDAAARIVRRAAAGVSAGRSAGGAAPGASPALTSRERECLELAAQGRTAAEMASILSVTERTIAFHLAEIRRRIGAANSRQAVGKAISLGIISRRD